MKTIQIVGAGCPKCRRLAENATAAAEAAGVEYAIEKVTDIDAMMKLGVMMTPALVIDGAVKAAGKVPSVEDIQAMLA